jgi:hypothetical protein
MQISNLSSQNKEQYEQSCLSSRLARQDSCPASTSQAQQQPGKVPSKTVQPITGAEEQLWKDFSASFRRRNNKIG